MDHSVSKFHDSKMYGAVITSNSIAGCYRQFNDLKKELHIKIDIKNSIQSNEENNQECGK